MKVFCVGDDILSNYDWKLIDDKKYRWIIYDYQKWSTGARIALVALHEDKKLRIIKKENCSSCAPIDDFSDAFIVSFTQFKPDAFDFSPDMRKQIKDLLHK